MSGCPHSVGPKTGFSPRDSILLSSMGGSGPAPRGSGKSHYRPLSSLYTHLDIPSPQPSPTLRRSTSVGGLHSFRNTMGLQFGSKGRKELFHAKSSVVSPPHSSRHPTKKRSMTSIFPASDPCTGSSSPPRCSDELPVIDISKKHVSYEELDVCDTFVPKNIWAKRCNMKLHPYHEQVAYMQAYDPISLENDRYTELLFERLTNGTPSFHDYGSQPPLMVLDLGCGQGHWIVHAANVWRNTEFVGLDIVDITLPAFQTVENVRLVQGDFLNYHLPFPDNTFDFVRIANLGLCIPYDKWEFVLSQVRRVLTLGGRLELIDDDMYFPYGEGWKEVEVDGPSSPLSGSLFGDEPLEAGNQDLGDKMREDEDMNDADSNLMNQKTTIIAGAADSGPCTPDLPSKSAIARLVPSCASHYVLRRNASFSHAPRNSKPRTPDLLPCEEGTELKQTVSPRSTPGHRRQCSGSTTSSRSSTPSVDAPPSSVTRRSGKLADLSPPCPKRTRERVTLLPPIRSITPTLSISSGSKYSPTWSVRTVDISPTSSDASSINTTSTSPTTSVRSVANKVSPNNSEWQRKVSSSKNMESLFEKMLVEQYGIHLRPAEFLLKVLGETFHEDGGAEIRVGIKKSFHIKLAPGDQSVSNYVGGRGSMDDADEMSPMSTGTTSTFSSTDAKANSEKHGGIPVTTFGPRPWEQARKVKGRWARNKRENEKDKNIKPKREVDGRHSKRQQIPAGTVRLTGTMTTSLFKKSRLHDPSLSTPVRPTLSAKAAVVLGIPYSELLAATSSLSLATSKEAQSVISSPCSFSSNLSAKAAGRLGLTYSEALSAAASISVSTNLIRPFSSLTISPTTDSENTSLPSNTTFRPVQHPGLLIWPDTYVPMAAGELEMHACKYIHTLLGCRPALEEFVEKFIDEKGNKFVGEEEFRDEIWEYECFRRSRFNWPSEVAEPYESDPTNANEAEPSSPPYTASSSTGTDTGGNGDANDPTAKSFDLPGIVMPCSVSANDQTSSITTHQPRASNDFRSFSNGKILRPTKSSLQLISSSLGQHRSSLSLSMEGKFKTLPLSINSCPAPPLFSSPSPSGPRRSSDGSMTENFGKRANLVHLRSIRVFEGIKAV